MKAAEADEWLEALEPVILLELEGDAPRLPTANYDLARDCQRRGRRDSRRRDLLPLVQLGDNL